ncbi:MAG: hypothetical protein ACFFDP_07220, partial [Promethearchaeota archaeon]
MMSIRQALVEYLDVVRTFAFEIASISSGVYDTDSPGKVLQNPILWVQKEADWIVELLEALDIIQNYVELVRRWANHVSGVAHNLGITDIEITKVERKQTSIVALLKMKSFDQDYLKWVLADISQEVDRLILPTQQLIEKAPRLLELTDQFRGFFMENVKKIVLAWTGQNLEELYNRLIEVLDAAHGSENPKNALKYIGSYCDIIFQVAFSTPMLIGESTTTAFSPKKMKTSQSRVDQIIEGIHDLREFVRLRKQAYLRFLQHLEVLIQAVLPP